MINCEKAVPKYLPGSTGERIRELREKAGLTQKQLAAELGMDQSRISKLEKNRTGLPDSETVLLLAGRFGVSTDFLLGRTDIPDRVNHDVHDLGLSYDALSNLNRKRFDMDVLNGLLESRSFEKLTRQIGVYLDETYTAGFAAKNQMMSSINMFLQNSLTLHPDMRSTALQVMPAVDMLKEPVRETEISNMNATLLSIIRELKEKRNGGIEDIRDMIKVTVSEVADGIDLLDMTVPKEEKREMLKRNLRGMFESATACLTGQDREIAGQLAAVLERMIETETTEGTKEDD